MGQFTEPAWFAAFGTAAGYGVLLAVMTLLVFGLPLLVYLGL